MLVEAVDSLLLFRSTGGNLSQEEVLTQKERSLRALRNLGVESQYYHPNLVNLCTILRENVSPYLASVNNRILKASDEIELQLEAAMTSLQPENHTF